MRSKPFTPDVRAGWLACRPPAASAGNR
jgi:hypothetical protein